MQWAATASKVHRDAITADRINIFRFQYFETKLFDIFQPFNFTCVNLYLGDITLANVLSPTFVLLWRHKRHDNDVTSWLLNVFMSAIVIMKYVILIVFSVNLTLTNGSRAFIMILGEGNE